jgi:positive regulator of sigma E activity
MPKTKKNSNSGCLIFIIPVIILLIFMILLYAFENVTGLSEDTAFNIFIAIISFIIIGYVLYVSSKK